jgi:hypothetical protein
LGELLNPGKPEFNPPEPPSEGIGATGGMESLLRGKREPAPLIIQAPVIASPTPAPAMSKAVVWSLAAADFFLVAAGATIAAQNLGPAGRGRFVFGLALIAFGSWFGWLAWRGWRKR